MLVILADLAAAGRCLAAVGLRVGMGMATRHPVVWRWRVEPCDRAQEIHATTCHTGCRQSGGGLRSLFLHQRSVGFLNGGDGRVRLIAKGGVEPPGVCQKTRKLVHPVGHDKTRRQGRQGFNWTGPARG
jgi:hypothetical protein